MKVMNLPYSGPTISNRYSRQDIDKEDIDNYFAELALAYMLEMAMLYDTLDLQSEAERLAHIQKMIDNYLNQLQVVFYIKKSY